MAVQLKITKYNLDKVRESLARAAQKLNDLKPVGKASTLHLLSMVTRNFASNSPKSKEWEPLSVVTLFVRRHRANAPTTSSRPLNDKGLLRNANFPFVEDGGDRFGIVNNLSYAPTQNFGGRVPPGEVLIKNFSRRTKTGMSKVIQQYFTMKFKGGQVPARPFFPVEDEYMPGIRRIMQLHVRGALNIGPGLGGTA